jgi:hypothetical protein
MCERSRDLENPTKKKLKLTPFGNVEKKEKKLYKKWMPFSKLHTIGF